MSSTSPQLLIDADIYLYRAASAAEDEIDWGDDIWSLSTDLKIAKDIFVTTLAGFFETFKTDKYILCLSDYKNFRKGIDPCYKGHRRKTRKPVGHRALVDWAKSEYSTFQQPQLEADDCLGILATKPGNNNHIIISDDKDLQTIPGRLYRPLRNEYLNINSSEADAFFLQQVLTGDTSDGYGGCPGIGPKKAISILGTRPSWQSVVKAFVAAGLTEDDAIKQAQLARILRWSDWDSENRVPIPWSPK